MRPVGPSTKPPLSLTFSTLACNSFAPMRMTRPASFAFGWPGRNWGWAKGCDGPREGLGVFAVVEMALRDVVERHLLGAHKAVHSQRRGLNGKFASQCVERHFKRKANARPSY